MKKKVLVGSSVAQAHNTGFGHCYLMVALPEVTVSSLLIPVIEFKKFHFARSGKGIRNKLLRFMCSAWWFLFVLKYVR